MALIFRKGTVQDTELFIQCLDEIKAGMPQKEWLYLDPPEEVRIMTSDGTLEMWLALDSGRPAAVFSVLYPGLHPYNYGHDLGLRKEDLLRVVHMDTAAVHPDYRGLGLQAKLMYMAELELSGRGERILLSTVHPENKYSLNNMLRQGFMVQKRVGKYGSDRYILRKNIF